MKVPPVFDCCEESLLQLFLQNNVKNKLRNFLVSDFSKVF